jgi:hypothetical protein
VAWRRWHHWNLAPQPQQVQSKTITNAKYQQVSTGSGTRFGTRFATQFSSLRISDLLRAPGETCGSCLIR